MPGPEFFAHATALVESQDIGTGTRIWAFAHVMKGARVGADCNVGDHAFIESGVTVGDRVTIKNNVLLWDGVRVGNDAFIGPGAIFTNDLFPRSPRMANETVRARYADRARWLSETIIGEGASIGAGAVIVAGTTVGAFAMVAAGSVVASNVAPHALVRGNPARQAGWVCRCGTRLETISATHLRCSPCRVEYENAGNGLTVRR